MALRFVAGSLVATAAAQRFIVKNECQETVWIASHGHSESLVQLSPGAQHGYHVENVKSTRFWPKMGCDGSGQRCHLGDSGGPGQQCGSRGCAPPVDSKFEATFSSGNGVDWWNPSSVDGFTLPYRIDLEGCPNGKEIDCSDLTMDRCPTSAYIEGIGGTDLNLRNPDTNAVVGCYSPCSLLSMNNWGNSMFAGGTGGVAEPYCCPGDRVEWCRAGPANTNDFTQMIHRYCPGTYAYAYDDEIGLQTCPATTVYTWTICPSGASPSPPPSGGTCSVGSAVTCPGSSTQCAGDQCCPDGSTCPSASGGFNGCSSGKKEDCTGGWFADAMV